MPIAVCKNEEQVRKWAEVLVKEGKFYVYYTTEDYEVILEPAKTTRPLRYCYIKMTGLEEAKKLAAELSQKYKLEIIEIASMRWDTEKGPAIKIEVEE